MRVDDQQPKTVGTESTANRREDAATISTATWEERGAHPRHAADAVRLVVGVIVLLVSAVLAHRASPSIVQLNIFRLINQLPNAFDPPMLGVMQLGALAAVPAVAALALVVRRPRLARLLLVCGGAAWGVAKILQTVVDEDPPAKLIGSVTLHGAVTPGLAFPATHVAVVAALATIAGPYLARRNRRLAWLIVGLVGVARVYVGAHMPIDVVGGAMVGWCVGSLIHLILGAPTGLPDLSQVVRALRSSGLSVDGISEVAQPEIGSVVYRVHIREGLDVAAKVVSRDQPEADWLYRVWRMLAYREIEDKIVLTSPMHRVDHEAYVLLAAERGGIRVPSVITTCALPEDEGLLARSWIEGTPLSSLSQSVDTDAALADVWHQLRMLHALGAAHGAPRADHWVIDEAGKAWLVELATTMPAANESDQLRDVAELCVSLAQHVDPRRVVASAVAQLGAERLVETLPYLQPLILSATTRHDLDRYPHLLQQLRQQVAEIAHVTPPPVQAPARVALRNILPLVGALFLVNLLLPQVGQVHATLDALHNVNWGWLSAVVAAAAATYLMAAIALLGAARRRLALGRTWAVQVATAFTNRVAPAGIGGMNTNVRYLEAAGMSRSAAMAAVGLRSIAGFIVHVVGIMAIAPLLGASNVHLHVRGPDVPDRWPLLLAVVGLAAALGLVRFGRLLRRKLARPVRTAFASLAGVVRSPSAATALFGGSAGVTAFYALALLFSVRAFGIGLGFSAIGAIFLGASAVASLSPTPGGLGALEAALVAGLTAAGAPTGPAVAAVLTYRLITYWLPILPGALIHHVLKRGAIL